MALTKRELIIQKALEKAPTVIGGDPDNKYMRCGYVMGATGWVCTQARLDAQAKAYPDSAEMIRKYGRQWIDMQCYDCAQLNRVSLAAADYKLVSGATSQARMPGMWEEEGTIDTLPGDSRALSLFIMDFSTGRMKHVAVCIGDGTEVEARGHKYGVVRRRMEDTSFTHWKKPVGLDSGDVTIVVPPTPGYDNPAYSKPMLKKGSKGGYVAEMQSRLVLHHIALPKYGIDGDFGNETQIALKQFQALSGLPANGVCDIFTWDALLKEPETNPPIEFTVTIPDRSFSEAQELVSKYPGAKMDEERS